MAAIMAGPNAERHHCRRRTGTPNDQAHGLVMDVIKASIA
jgi:hypothetical protein